LEGSGSIETYQRRLLRFFETTSEEKWAQIEKDPPENLIDLLET